VDAQQNRQQSEIRKVSPGEDRSVYGGKDLWKRCVLSQE